MSSYIVEVLVTYKVEANSEDEALEIINFGAEFPVMPFEPNTYNIKDEIVGIRKNN